MNGLFLKTDSRMIQAARTVPSGLWFGPLDSTRIIQRNCHQRLRKEFVMGIGTILIIVLILLLIGGLPVFPHSRSWGYGPSGIIGTILVILLILVLLGRI
jgi:hypothetical protein